MGSRSEGVGKRDTVASDCKLDETFDPIFLETPELRVTVLPGLGGKISSMVALRTGAELLFQPLRPYRRATRDSDFAASDKSGFDECLPSVSACDQNTPGGAVPDHGDVWRLPWRVERKGNAWELTVNAFTRPLRLMKRIELRRSCLKMDYRVENLSPHPVTFLWSSHPALAVEQGDRIALPAEVRQLCIEHSLGGRLGATGATVSWPTTKVRDEDLDLAIAGASDAGTADKLFTGPLRKGWCGLYRERLRQGLCFRFHPQEIPYVGMWLCYGGWPEDQDTKQYTVALEPASSPRDSLKDAIAAGTAARLQSGEAKQWTLRLSLIQLPDRSMPHRLGLEGSESGNQGETYFHAFREACEREPDDLWD